MENQLSRKFSMRVSKVDLKSAFYMPNYLESFPVAEEGHDSLKFAKALIKALKKEAYQDSLRLLLQVQALIGSLAGSLHAKSLSSGDVNQSELKDMVNTLSLAKTTPYQVVQAIIYTLCYNSSKDKGYSHSLVAINGVLEMQFILGVLAEILS